MFTVENASRSGRRATTSEPVWLGKEKKKSLLRSARDGAVVIGNEKKETGPKTISNRPPEKLSKFKIGGSQ